MQKKPPTNQKTKIQTKTLKQTTNSPPKPESVIYIYIFIYVYK